MTMNQFAKVRPGHYENDDFVIMRYATSPARWGLFRKTPVGLNFIEVFSLLTLAKRRVGEIYKAICEMEV